MNKISKHYGFTAYSGRYYAYQDKSLLQGKIYLNGLICDGAERQYVVEVAIENYNSEFYAYRSRSSTLANLETLTSIAIADSIHDAFELFTKIRAAKILRHAYIFVPIYKSNNEYEVIASLIPFTSEENIDVVLDALAPVADRYGEAIAMGIHRKEELGLYNQDNQNNLIL